MGIRRCHIGIPDTLMNAILYAVLLGVGSGLIIKAGYTTGGSETIAKILYRKCFSYMKYSQVLLMVDLTIISSGLFVFGLRMVMYAIVIKVISTKVMDAIMFGMGGGLVKLVIISEHYQEISSYIQIEIHRGTTIVDIEGGYSHALKKQIHSICTPKESIKIKQFVANTSDRSFIEVIPIKTVWGNGFLHIRSDELG